MAEYEISSVSRRTDDSLSETGVSGLTPVYEGQLPQGVVLAHTQTPYESANGILNIGIEVSDAGSNFFTML